jgi:hypothetical protein
MAMGRHTRPDEPVPHPLDRAGAKRVPADGRRAAQWTPATGEPTGSQRIPGRGGSTGSFETAGPTETTTSFRATGRGENTGAFRTPGRRTDSGTSRAPGRGEDSRAARGGENTGSFRAAGRGEESGSFRAARRGGDTGSFRAAGHGEASGSHPVVGRGEATGSHKVAGKAEATGSHRIVGKKAPRRRIALWPIACLVLAALIGLGIVGWNWADSELNSRAEAQAASCSGGTSHMRVIVTPSVQKPMDAAATRWNQAATVVHGQCVHVMIEAKPSSQVLDALVGRSNLDAIGGLPAAWLPESSYWVSELTTKKPEMIGSPAQSVATARSADYPFVGLTGPGIDDTVLRAAQTFREYLEQPAQQADFTAAGIKAA